MKKFDIKDVTQLREALAGLAFQGKEGEFEIKDAAERFGKMASAAQRFGLQKGPEGVRILGGLSQIAKGANDSPAEAATAVEAMFRQLVKKSDKLAAAGVHVFEKGSTSKTRDIRQVLPELIAARGGGLKALQKDMDDRGIRAISPLISRYNETQGTKDEKKAAVRQMLDEAINAAGDWGEVMKDATQAQSDAGARLVGAWETLKAAAGERLAPAVADLATRIAGNQKALDLFAGALTAAGVSLEAFADFLAKRGLIEGGTPEEQKNAALKKVAQYEGQLQHLDPNSQKYREVMAKRNKAVEAVAEAKRQEAIEKAGPANMNDKIDMFAERYAKAGGVDNPLARMTARAMAQRLAKDPNDWLASSDVANIGETDKQFAERHRFMNREGGYAPKGLDVGDTSTKGIIAEAMAAVTSAAAEQKAAATATKAAADRLGQRPTVAGGTN